MVPLGGGHAGKRAGSRVDGLAGWQAGFLHRVLWSQQDGVMLLGGRGGHLGWQSGGLAGGLAGGVFAQGPPV